MTATARARVMAAALAAGVACGDTSGPSGCITEATLLAATPPSGTALAPGQSVEISALFRIAACQEAGVFMFVRDSNNRTIGAQGGDAQVPIGLTTLTIVGTVSVPAREAVAISVEYVMMPNLGRGRDVLARLDYPVR